MYTESSSAKNLVPFVGDNAIDISSSATSYIAPDNGWLYGEITASEPAAFIQFMLDNGFTVRSYSPQDGYGIKAALPLRKGQTAAIRINAPLSTAPIVLKFYH